MAEIQFTFSPFSTIYDNSRYPLLYNYYITGTVFFQCCQQEFFRRIFFFYNVKKKFPNTITGIYKRPEPELEWCQNMEQQRSWSRKKIMSAPPVLCNRSTGSGRKNLSTQIYRIQFCKTKEDNFTFFLIVRYGRVFFLLIYVKVVIVLLQL